MSRCNNNLKVVTETFRYWKNRKFWPPSPMSHLVIFSLAPCHTPISDKLLSWKWSDPWCDFEVLHFMICAYFLHKMDYFYGQLHQKVNKMALSQFMKQFICECWNNIFLRDDINLCLRPPPIDEWHTFHMGLGLDRWPFYPLIFPFVPHSWLI